MYVHGCTWLQNKSTILRKSLNSPQSHEVTHLEPLFPKHLRDFKRPRGLPRSLPDRPCRHGTALVAAGRSQRLHGLRVDGALHGPPHLVERTAQLWTATSKTPLLAKTSEKRLLAMHIIEHLGVAVRGRRWSGDGDGLLEEFLRRPFRPP